MHVEGCLTPCPLTYLSQNAFRPNGNTDQNVTMLTAHFLITFFNITFIVQLILHETCTPDLGVTKASFS